MSLTNRKTSRGGLALAALASLLALPAVTPEARADWLVTREGARLETKGPWTVRGKLVVFTLPDGTLSSVRLDQVDLEASRRAEEELRQERQRAAAPAEKPKRKSVVSLTDRDFKKAGPLVDPAAAAGEEGQTASASSAPAAGGAAASGLEVVDWERAEATDGLAGVRLLGKVRNGGANPAAGVAVIAQLYDDAGTLIGQIPAEVETNLIQPGETASFVVNAEGTFSFSGVKFQVRAAPLRGGSAQAAKPAAEPQP